ncbi:hypothetical protein ROHU_020210 [Labeo rohita]|uniref:Uncharacterized protein n=1 Tax=Labeo rohita TaxID=84645 RepID=A0A498MYT2_LABRO|nr:hypothetical protein ROHU_020210 [Labeo rohita]
MTDTKMFPVEIRIRERFRTTSLTDETSADHFCSHFTLLFSVKIARLKCLNGGDSDWLVNAASTGRSVSQPRERSEFNAFSTTPTTRNESDRERLILTDLKRLRLPATSPPLAGHVTCQNQTGSCHQPVEDRS